MKNQLLCLLVFFIFYQDAFCQMDKQWLVLNEKGKHGLDVNGNNKYDNVLAKQFYLENVKYPSNIIAHARNDIFVIYKDGKHFNSRALDEGKFFYPTTPSQQNNRTHNFFTVHNSPIAGLYLTHRYEEDDPPDLVHAKKSTSTQADPIYQMDITSDYGSEALQADHDITRNKDITLIINQNALPYALVSSSSFKVVYDSLAPLKPGLTPVWAPAFFDFSPVFNVSGQNYAGFPLTTCDTRTNPTFVKLKYNADSSFSYINLRLKSISDDFMPDQDGKPKYAAVFRVVDTRTNLTVARHQESLLNSHDPNFIRVDSICKGRDSTQIVYYYFQFRNTSLTTPASGIEIKFSFPADFIESCFEVMEWSPNSTLNKVEKVNGVYHFIFDPASTLSICRSPEDMTSCTGFIRFKIGVPASINLRRGEQTLHLINPVTIFDKMPYAVTDFRDILNPAKDYWYRKVTIGDCTCKKPICIRCIIGGIVAGAGILFLIFWRKRKKVIPPNP